jgi:hypothetical protein
MEDNYDFNFPKRVDVNYPRTFMYDAHVNILDKAIPFQTDHMSRGRKKRKESITQKSQLCGFSQVGINVF